MARQLRSTTFRTLSLSDPFFDSLKAGYKGFEAWFKSKAHEELYVVDDKHRLSGMIYLKQEDGSVSDVEPALPPRRWLKVGTLKIEGRGTKLGERVLKKILDTAIEEDRNGVYITVFELHSDLIRLFERYGFKRYAVKRTADGTELVLARELTALSGDIVQDYPFFRTRGRKVWLLAVYPEYHSQLLPDSILNNEPREIVRDVSHTNTIHKMYIGRLSLTRMTRGDIVVIYRTTDGIGPAFYRSVATSICIVEETKTKKDFADEEAFLKYASPHSVFSRDELREKYSTENRLYVAKMTYNSAFNKRITRGRLLEEAGISEHPRWDLRELSSAQLERILEMGSVNARLVVD
ncbi:GNAT family N-acetyltransferase [Bradyrhizobium sp. AUGA SZCCT0169]|uniref:GNAT family N-acetyltransferase n=1 Tax=Bradyrhizobium sp. AUGA SZCCT0169 TaxID=2807663 RepID=UPI001BA5B5E5|nr:GNAT family N-acetyltransferase [Bradyrhizobium sp. AUGA SZCCT0169]MBR1245983.1 GNAT family N-acetyltransferase [Bradyrhizobium sp. AUGA SZCCT0169]